MSSDEAVEAGPEVEAAVTQALSTILGGVEASMVVKWTALVETMNADGERGLWTLTSANNKAWDTVGMLQHALNLQQAQTTSYVFDAEMDADTDLDDGEGESA